MYFIFTPTGVIYGQGTSGEKCSARLGKFTALEHTNPPKGGFVCLAVSLSGLRRLGRDRAVLPGLFVPAATQRLVQIDLAGQLRKTVADQ